MKNNKTICLCAIVKNEEKVLKRLIDSCLPIIDYWVIIDTGSTDGTKELIQKELVGKIPGELHESVFINFGHNRNEVIQKAKDKADYLLLMDADMAVILSPGFNKNDLTADWYLLRYEGELDFAQPLLVKSSFDWQYKGSTHEYIIADGTSNWVELKTMKLHHYGDGGMRYDKLERDKRLLEQDIATNPSDPRNYFYLGQTLANMGKYDQAIDAYSKRASLNGWAEEIYYSLYQIGIAQYNKKNYDSAILQFLEAYDIRPTRFEPLYHLGLIHRELKKYSTAIIFLERILKQPYPHQDVLFVHKNQYDYLADFELAICYFYSRQYEKAKTHAEVVKRNKSVPKNISEQNDKNYEFILKELKVKNKTTNDYIFCSMFTVDTPYEQEIKILQKSLDDLNIAYEFVGVRNQGSWIKNTQLKPSVIKGVMLKHNKDVIWVDADAIVNKLPVWFDTVNCDIACYKIEPWNEVLTGTVYFSNNKKVLEFIDKWIYLAESGNEPDANTFRQVYDAHKDSMRYVSLPADYIKIFDNDLIVSSDPVITHNQASRRFKDKVNTVVSDYIEYTLKGFIGDRKSCSIIGNGPFESDLSKAIDDSFVIRCNNFVLNGFKGIGSRVDLNVSSLYHEIIPTTKVFYPILGVLPLSDTLYQSYTDAKQMHIYWSANSVKLRELGINVLTYNEKDQFANIFSEVAKEINAFPTVGIMAIALARWMKFEKIIISGFTFFQTDRSHYFTDKKILPSSHHNPNAERDLLMKWIKNDTDCKYLLDSLTIKSLQYATA